MAAVSQDKVTRIQELRAEGLSYPVIAERVGVSVGTAQKYGKETQAEAPVVLHFGDANGYAVACGILQSALSSEQVTQEPGDSCPECLDKIESYGPASVIAELVLITERMAPKAEHDPIVSIEERLASRVPCPVCGNLYWEEDVLQAHMEMLHSEGQQGQESTSEEQSGGEIQQGTEGEASSQKKSRAAIHNDQSLITLLVEKNPKREGTMAWGRFELYENGMKVINFLSAGGRRDDLRYDTSHGYIRID